jgi:MinD-like ATPase involved in chromosome partitioning or flagellar assembly
MMIDQASELRKLVLQSVRQQVAQTGPAPHLILVTAGREGVGATTLTVNLCVALAEHGARVVAVDADLHHSDMASLCGLTQEQLLPPVARRDIHEVLARGPAGIQIIPGLWPGREHEWSEAAQQRLLRQFQTLGRHADLIVVDAGSGTNRFLKRCCQVADDLLLVTTHDVAAVVETYAHIKTLVAQLGNPRLRLVVNRCDDEQTLQDVYRRLDQSCRRFLSQPLTSCASIPDDPAVGEAAAAAVPFLLGSPDSPAARSLAQLASLLVQSRRLAHRDAA